MDSDESDFTLASEAESLDFEALFDTLGDEILQAELNTTAIDHIMSDLVSSPIYCTTNTSNESGVSTSTTTSEQKSTERASLTERLLHLIRAPARMLSCYNASNLKELRRIINDICEESCTLKTLTLNKELTGRHHYMELFLTLQRMFPDHVIKHKRTVYNRKQNIISVFSEATGTKLFSDLSEHVVDTLRYGDKAVTNIDPSLQKAHDSIEQTGGMPVYTTHTVQNLVLNEKQTHAHKVIVIARVVRIARSVDFINSSGASGVANSAQSSDSHSVPSSHGYSSSTTTLNESRTGGSKAGDAKMSGIVTNIREDGNLVPVEIGTRKPKRTINVINEL